MESIQEAENNRRSGREDDPGQRQDLLPGFVLCVGFRNHGDETTDIIKYSMCVHHTARANTAVENNSGRSFARLCALWGCRLSTGDTSKSKETTAIDKKKIRRNHIRMPSYGPLWLAKTKRI